MIAKNNITLSLRYFLLYGFAYLIILTAFAQVWAKYPQFLYMYRDGEYNLWISLQYAEWAKIFDLTAINPIEGMTTMLVAINPYFDPGQWVFLTTLPQSVKMLSSYAIYAFEVLLSTFGLGIALGFSRLYSFVASIFTALLLFPPFNFLFGLGGWFAGAPLFGHTLALTNLSLIICLNLGNHSSYNTKYGARWKNLLLVGILVFLFLAILIPAPFYNAGILAGTLLSFGFVILSSQTREQLVWRVFAGLAIIASFYVLGLPEFYNSAKIYSARFAENQPFIVFNWPKAGWFNHTAITNAKNELCAFGVQCDAVPGWPFSISSIWFNAAIIIGGIFAWLTLPKSSARIGILISIAWVILLLGSTLMGFHIILSMLSPAYFYLMMYSLLALYSLYALSLPLKLLTNRIKIHLGSTQLSLLTLIIAVAVSVSSVLLFGTGTGKIVKLVREDIKNSQTVMLADRHQATPIIELLKQEVALHPGSPFRGSVATIYGDRNGTLRKSVGINSTEPLQEWEFEKFLTAASKSGSSHDLLDLWTWNIPTLSEYGQGLSRPLIFYMSKFFSSPADALEPHFAFPHIANVDILRALGVRFIIIDAPIFSKEVTLKRQLPVDKVATLYLYEISTPNLGNYSPTHLQVLKSSKDFYQDINTNPALLKTHAYVEQLPKNIDLTPAYDAKMVFSKGGIHLSAKSKGTSALLIPIQYSHCYRLAGPTSTNAKITRANLIHTLIIFDKTLDINLIWQFRWKQSACRKQDVADLKILS